MILIMETSRPRAIIHLDLDCFFVSVERISHPELRGKPVAVGGSPSGRGVVASCSYEARTFGVRSAMPTAQALRLCPGLIVRPGHHGHYGEVSQRIAKRLEELAPIVEQASIDEFYLDVTGCESLYGNDLRAFLGRLQQVLLDEFSLPCTVSLASTKTLAKIATDTVKPAGRCVVPSGTEREFLSPLPVSAIPGVGPKTREHLSRHHLFTIADVQRLGREALVSLLGAHGLWLWKVAQGGGTEIVAPEHERKSIGREETFPKDVTDEPELRKILLALVEDVSASMRRSSLKARKVSLKLRYSDFTTLTRDRTIPPTNDDAVVLRWAIDLLHKTLEQGRPVRLLGVRASEFLDDAQTELKFQTPEEKRETMLKAVDELRRKYGDDIIHATQL
jgi:DNA polymerase-4